MQAQLTAETWSQECQQMHSTLLLPTCRQSITHVSITRQMSQHGPSNKAEEENHHAALVFMAKGCRSQVAPPHEATALQED